MKYCTFLTVLLLVTIPKFSFAQETNHADIIPKTLIKLNFSELLRSTFMIELEKLNTKKNASISFGLGFTSRNRKGGVGYEHPEFEKAKGVKGELLYRQYVNGFNSKISKRRQSYILGVYGGLLVKGGYDRNKGDYETYDRQIDEYVTITQKRSGYWIQPGVVIGYSRTYLDKVLLDIHFGGGIRFTKSKKSDDYKSVFSYYGAYKSVLDHGGVTPILSIRLALLLNND